MKILLTALLAAIVSAAPATAQDWARAKLDNSPRHQEWVTVKYGNRSLSCFVVYPEVSNRAPAVLMVHEIFGLSDWAMDEADQIAAAGYIAIAPDLLSGLGAKGGGTSDFPDRSAVTRAVSGLPPAQVTADLDAAADYAEKLPSCNGRLLVAGFCWGGTTTFAYATHRADLKAAFVFYGMAPKEGLSSIPCPVYGFYGGNDARISATVPDTVSAMKSAGKSYDPVIYTGAGHGFMRAGEDPQTNPANRAAHDQAWARWAKLMAQVSASSG
jgi:carboxymethylenebutenolidase